MRDDPVQFIYRVAFDKKGRHTVLAQVVCPHASGGQERIGVLVEAEDRLLFNSVSASEEGWADRDVAARQAGVVRADRPYQVGNSSWWLLDALLTEGDLTGYCGHHGPRLVGVVELREAAQREKPEIIKSRAPAA